jgi:uncharacterized membrane protein
MSKRKRQNPPAQRHPETNSTAAPESAPSPAKPVVAGSAWSPILLARLCLVLAAAVALYLLWVSVRGGSVAGCGPGSDCDKVLQSRWSKWFGLPVSGFSLLIYAALFASSLGLRRDASSLERQRAGCVLLSGALLVLGAAVWYTVLQFAVIRAICPYCMTAHALGSAAAILLLAARARDSVAALTNAVWPKLATVSGVLLAILIGGQIVHEPRSHIERNVAVLASNSPSISSNAPTAFLPPAATSVTTATTQAAVVTPPPTASVPADTNSPLLPKTAARTNRVFSIYNGQFKFNLDEVPLIGSPTAPHVMVSLFDYTCHHCRTMHERLLEAQHTWAKDLAIIVLPMPLNAECNPTVKRTPPDHINACFFGRLGLAVVRADRAKAAQFDEFVFKPERPPATNDAMMFAEQLVGPDALKRALADPWVENQLKQDVSIYEISFRAGQGSMPQSIIGNRIAVGLMRQEDLVRILVAEFGLKTPAP